MSSTTFKEPSLDIFSSAKELRAEFSDFLNRESGKSRNLEEVTQYISHVLGIEKFFSFQTDKDCLVRRFCNDDHLLQNQNYLILAFARAGFGVCFTPEETEFLPLSCFTQNLIELEFFNSDFEETMKGCKFCLTALNTQEVIFGKKVISEYF